MALQLVKISDFDQVTDPKEWIVVSDASGVAYKISREDFKSWLGTVQEVLPHPLAITDDTPTEDGVYYPIDIGIYPNGLENKEGYDTKFVLSDGVWVAIEKELPHQQKTDVVEKDNTDVVESGAVWLNLDKKFINKGKAYPFVNQPEPITNAVSTMNNIVLDVEVEETSRPSNPYFVITLITRNVSNNDWGNAIHIRQLNSNGDTITSVAFRSTDTNLGAQTIQQLNKIEAGGLQRLSLYSQALNRWFHITIDSDSIADGQLVDASYTNTSNKMYFDESVYKRVATVDASQYANKSEVTPLQDWQNTANRFLINKGKDYPIVGYPTIGAEQTKVDNLKNILLDAELYPDGNLYTYYIGGFYKNQITFGNGVILMRKLKSSGAIGSLYLTSSGSGTNNIDAETISDLGKWSLGGVQTTTFNITNTNFGIKTLTLTVDTDAFEGYVPIGFQDNDNWGNSSFNPITYKKIIPSAEPTNQIAVYDTFKEALTAQRTGLVKIGSMLAESKVSSVVNPGNAASFKPSAVYNQYRSLNVNSDAFPKKMSQIMEIKMENGATAQMKSFGRRYIYFGDGNNIYRTQDELKYDEITHLNTSYEKIILPEPLPDNVYSTANSIQNVYELDNGELLIESRNGGVETEGDPYQGRRVQLYVTDGFKSVVPTTNSNGIPEYDVTGIVSKVHEYKAYTSTRGKTGTVVSIVGSRIALTPYYIGLVGLCHYSNDFGKTWRVIFNMGVMDEEFSVPYKGSPGAWPLPENLNPPMPANMWTEGGNTNYHTHGVCIDPYYDNRIWIATGDAGSNALGRSAIWYTDDEGQTWTRVQSKGEGVYDAPSGIQPMGFIATKDYVLMSSDSSIDGLYRHNRGKKTDVSKFEAAYWYLDEYRNNLRVIGGGGVVTREGYVYYLFHPNTPTFYSRGVVVFTSDGLNFEEVYFDEVSDGTSSGDRNINWGSWLGQDRYGNIYIANSNNKVIKLF